MNRIDHLVSFDAMWIEARLEPQLFWQLRALATARIIEKVLQTSRLKPPMVQKKQASVFVIKCSAAVLEPCQHHIVQNRNVRLPLLSDKSSCRKCTVPVENSSVPLYYNILYTVYRICINITRTVPPAKKPMSHAPRFLYIYIDSKEPEEEAV